MKILKLKYPLLLIGIAFVFSCGKRPINGKLDGRWQLMTIDYHHADSINQGKPAYTYFDFQRELMQLTQTQGDEYNNKKIWVRFNHIQDSLHVKAASDNPSIQVKPLEMLPYGMNNTIQYFAVEKLTNKKMILNSKFARLNLRKF